jgi:murein DD-endopeptidase MepM/ murein hydrolase activator NlpD
LNAENIIFKNGKHTVFQAKMIDENTFDVSLVGSDDGDFQVISAIYIKDSMEIILGKLFVPAFEKRLHNIKIIPTFAGNFDFEHLKTQINPIFEPYLIGFNIATDDAFLLMEWDLNGNGVLDVVGSSWISTLTDEMKAINRLYGENRETSRDGLYLFLLEKGPSNRDGISIAGDMPRGSQFGYLFWDASQDMLAKTAAHEIGHGLFRLKHTFDEDYRIPQNSTNNLMDYGNGTSLSYWQWLQLFDAPTVWDIFENDGDAMATANRVNQMIESLKTSYTENKNTSLRLVKNSIQNGGSGLVFGNRRYNSTIAVKGLQTTDSINAKKVGLAKNVRNISNDEYFDIVIGNFTQITLRNKDERDSLFEYITTVTQDPNKPKPGDPLVNMEIVHTNTAPNSGGMFGCARAGDDNCTRISQTLNLPKYDNKKKVHDGIDLYASVETNVYSMYDGEVVFIKKDVPPNAEGTAAFGNYIVIKYTSQQHGNKGTKKTIFALYAHLNSVDGNIKVNQKVDVGQFIGKSGCTGNATYLTTTDTWRQHLHLTIYEGSWANENRVDPRTYITTKFDNNGNKTN